MTNQTIQLECGHSIIGGVGYGVDSQGRRFCYECCAKRDRQDMTETGRAVLYAAPYESPEQLVGMESRRGLVRRWRVTNWPGSLEFQARNVRHFEGRGFGGAYPITTGEFTGPDGALWRFRQAGHWNQIARCHRVAQQREC